MRTGVRLELNAEDIMKAVAIGSGEFDQPLFCCSTRRMASVALTIWMR